MRAALIAAAVTAATALIATTIAATAATLATAIIATAATTTAIAAVEHNHFAVKPLKNDIG